MLREVPIRMFLSLAERINVLKEPKLTPDVSTGFRPPCWARSLRRALTRRVHTKHYDFQLYPLPKTSYIPEALARCLFITLLRYFNCLTQFIEW